MYSWSARFIFGMNVKCSANRCLVLNVEQPCIFQCTKHIIEKMAHTPEHIPPQSFNSLNYYEGPCYKTPPTFTSCFHHGITNLYILDTIIHTNTWWPQRIFNCFQKKFQNNLWKIVIIVSEKNTSSRKTIHAPMDYKTPENKRVVPI